MNPPRKSAITDREECAMNEQTAISALESKTDFIPYESYTSPEFARGEKERMWPRVWLVAAREEDLGEPGQFVTFDVADESILITRDTTGQIRAFFNVCPHRGRRIAKGCGLAAKFYCNYHGWQWNLDGTNKVMIDAGDWTGIGPADVGLRPVRVDTWGGFIFVNIDGQAEPLLDFLHPWPEMWKNYRLEDMRYRWFKTTKLNCNWKVALEAFLEGYHAQTTHRQVNPACGENRWECQTFGRHSMFYDANPASVGAPNPNLQYIPGLGAEAFIGADRRERIYRYLKTVAGDLHCLFTDRMVEAARRLPERVSDDADDATLMGAFMALHYEICARDGVEVGQLPPEELGALGIDWNMFPNLAILPTLDGLLIYRARPDGDDPDKCLFDIFPLERFAPGLAPKVTREFYENWRDGNYPRIFVQDFDNVDEVQRGMKSTAFAGALSNPRAEKVVWNLHRELREMVLGE